LVPWDINANEAKERSMTLMTVLNLILAAAVVGGLTAICRAAYLRAQHRDEVQPTRLETPQPVELDRAA
jgi:hypothetical protein